MRLSSMEIILLLVALLLLFGASRLPQLGSSLGSAIRNFKKGFGGEPDAEEDQKAQNLSAGGNVHEGQGKSKVSSRDS